MKEDRKGEFKKFMGGIEGHLRDVFAGYNCEVDKRNNEPGGGVLQQTDRSEKIYAHLLQVSKELNAIQKQLHSCDKLRKQRRELFSHKTSKFVAAIAQLIQDKNIKLKINKQVELLVAQSKECTAETASALRLYKNESASICGKSYDYKPAVEKAFLELSELGFLWDKLGGFESVANDSVPEVFMPIQYKPAEFKQLEEQIGILWAELCSRFDKSEKVSAPPPAEPVIEKSDLQLAHECLFGFTRPQEVARAIEIYQKEASRPSPDPTVFNVLGVLHEQGKGFPKDCSKAFKYFMRSAEKGNPEGLYKVGQYLEKGLLNFKHYFDGLYANRDAEVRGGIEYYEKAAAKGHLDALTDLGFIYEKGVIHEGGVEFFIEPHPNHAKKYYEKAKEKQFPRAYNNLGNLLICENVESTTLSHNAGLQKGVKYLSRAKELACPKASLNLGKCYLSGTGVPLNLEKARSLFKEATELGELQGRLEYLRSYIGTSLDEEETMNELADTGRMLLIENRSNPEALFMMGLLEEKGIGVAPNKESSFHYIAAAARQDYPPALTRLGDYYYSGHYIDKSYDSAKLLYEKAAEKGDSQAFLNLALMQEKGLLAPGTTIGSVDELYRKAEQLGSTNAVLMSGLRREGSLARNDKVLMAAEQGNYQALKMLTQNNNYFATSSSPGSEMKKISTFYMKQTLPSRKKFDSLI